MSNWRDKLYSTKDVKILESESSSEEKVIKINLDKYKKAHQYFKNKTALTEIRSDISGRFGYLEYFLHLKGNVSRDSPDDYCSKIILNETFEELMTIIVSVTFDRNKYAKEWDCCNTIDITNFDNEIEIREWIISGRCKKCQDHAFTSRSLKELQGTIVYDNFICHGVQGKPPNVSYDLFYTYVTRISRMEQLEMCNNKKCSCMPKVFLPENEFKINVVFDQEDNLEKKEKPKVKRNDLCPCGSNKKYKKCCYLNNTNEMTGTSPDTHLEQTQATIANHMLRQNDMVKPKNNANPSTTNKNSQSVYKVTV